MSDFKPREWQQRAVDICRSLAQKGADRALIYACPGSGKTFGGLLVASDLGRKGGKGPRIIVLTPNLAIKSQWITRASEIGLKLLPVASGIDLRQDDLGLEEIGFILSYQQAISLKHSLRQYCATVRPIVILDEVHHTEGPKVEKDGNAWGHAVEYACAEASFKICTTGTPFREGNNPISFVTYNDNLTAIPDVEYPYERAIADRVCRPIEFAMFEGRIQWMDGADKVSASFSDKLTKKRARQRLRAALSTDGDHPRTLLAEANSKLNEIRAGTSDADKHAAGIILAMDVEHASELATELQTITGEAPMVVHNKIDEAQTLINTFRDGDARWIIGINMLSEGVDIPRLRVGVYLSNIRAALYLHQFFGRLSRVIDRNAVPRERSYVFLPADPELEAVALEVEKPKAHALGEEYHGHIRRVGGNGRGRIFGVEVIDSDGHEDAAIGSGRRYPKAYMDLHRERAGDFIRMDPGRAGMSHFEAIKIMIDLGVIQAPYSEAAE